MGWFDEQIKTRKTRDNDDFAEAMESIAAVIVRRPQSGSASRRQQIKNAMDEILLYYHARPAELPDEVEEPVVIKCTGNSPHGALVNLLDRCYKHRLYSISLFSLDN